MKDQVFIIEWFDLTDVFASKEEAVEAYKDGKFSLEWFEKHGKYVPVTDSRVHHIVKWSKAAEDLLKNIQP
jgi:hypothetical protein